MLCYYPPLSPCLVLEVAGNPLVFVKKAPHDETHALLAIDGSALAGCRRRLLQGSHHADRFNHHDSATIRRHGGRPDAQGRPAAGTDQPEPAVTLADWTGRIQLVQIDVDGSLRGA